MTHLLALLGILIISFSAILVRLADVSPAGAAFFRMAYAVPVLAAIWLAGRSSDRRTMPQHLMAAAAGFILATDLTLWHRSIGLIGAGLATVLANIQVVVVGVLAWLLHRERPTAAALATIPAVLAGVVLISGLGRTDAYGSDPVPGALLGAAAGALYAIFLVFFRASNRGLAPPAGPLLDATLGAAAGALLYGSFDPVFTLVPAWPEHGWLLLLALLPQTAGWLLIARTLPRLPALETSVMLLMQPAATLLWGILIFGESLSLLQGTGVLLVLGGVAVITRSGAVEPVPESAEP
ncbi:MAG: DMT family transporter [bacterium]